MVLLEAMVLGKPIVATDIDGNRGLLGKLDYGYLVPNSREGLVEGLESVLVGDAPACDFSAENYRRAAIKQFVEVAVDRCAMSADLTVSRSGMRCEDHGVAHGEVSQ